MHSNISVEDVNKNLYIGIPVIYIYSKYISQICKSDEAEINMSDYCV